MIQETTGSPICVKNQERSAAQKSHLHPHYRKIYRHISAELGEFPRLGEVSLPNLLRMRGAQAQKEVSMRPKRSNMYEFIQGKRDILLAKMRVNEKHTNLKNLQEKMAYEKSQLQMRMNFMREDTQMLDRTLEGLKKEVEGLTMKIKEQDGISEQQNRQLFEIKKKTHQKEIELRNIKQKLDEFGNYKEFIVLVYEHFGKEFEEGEFLNYFEDFRKFLKGSFNARQTWSSIAVKLKEENWDMSPNPLFLTAAQTICNRQTSPARIPQKIQLLADFSNMMTIIENDHFDLFSELQVEEANVIELENDKKEFFNQVNQAKSGLRKAWTAAQTAFGG